jgi:hypothetical protein
LPSNAQPAPQITKENAAGVAAVGGRLRARFPALSSASLSLSALAALSSEEARQLAAGLGACGSTLTSFSLHNNGERVEYNPPLIWCYCSGSNGDLVDELRIAHPAAMTLRLTTLLSSLPGLATLDLRGLADLAGHVGPSGCYCECVSAAQRGFVEVFHVYSLLGAFTSRLRSLSLACDCRGNGLGLLAASVDALAPSLRHLSITAAYPDEIDEGYDSDDSDALENSWRHAGTAFLGRLTSLEALELSGCDYTGPPAWLASLTGLTRLEVDCATFLTALTRRRWLGCRCCASCR